jgi:membrane-bound ClpP family serine protease
VANGSGGPDAYANPRKWTGILLFVIGSFLALLDAFRTDFEVNPIVLFGIFIVGLALFGVATPKLPFDGGR